MSQRLIAAVVAAPLVAALLLLSVFMPLPYVIYRPGLTVDVLGTSGEREIVQIEGAESFHDDGQLRMTTVTVTPPKPTDVNLIQLMLAWVDDDNAVVPYDAVYAPDETVEENDREGAAQMSSSQDIAVGVALDELGYDVRAAQVAEVAADGPAAGALQPGDLITEVDGRSVTSSGEVSEAIGDAEPGSEVELTVQRGDAERQVRLTPETVDGEQRVGISVGPGFLPAPVGVGVGIPSNISGPSAGLMFSLAIYDTLTPGSLTGGGIVAGTGEMRGDGSVGPIGGIDQKIAGARRDGAQLFLVPPDNCADAGDAEPGDMRLVLAETMHDARIAIADWAEDPDADLPQCSDLETTGALP